MKSFFSLRRTLACDAVHTQVQPGQSPQPAQLRWNCTCRQMSFREEVVVNVRILDLGREKVGNKTSQNKRTTVFDSARLIFPRE